MADEGYYLIETEQLDYALKAFHQADFFVALCYWLIDELYLELKDQLANVEIEVIKICHHHPNNVYPGIGIQYEAETRDVESLVAATIDRLLEERSALELITFLQTTGVDWRAEAARIMS